MGAPAVSFSVRRTGNLTALSRPPCEEEKTLGREALALLTEGWGNQRIDRDEAARRALTTYCHTILNSAAFLYID